MMKLPDIDILKSLWYNDEGEGSVMKKNLLSLSKIKLPILISIGVFATIMSFVYYFVLKNPSEIILWLIYVIDFLLFFISAYRVVRTDILDNVVDCFEVSRGKHLLFTILTMLGFFIFCEIVAFALLRGINIISNTELFFNTFRVSLFLSPCFILLIPVIMFIGRILEFFHCDRI